MKKPLDITKRSKAGRLSLVPHDHGHATVAWADDARDVLQVVFENGELKNETTFADVRARAAGAVPVI